MIDIITLVISVIQSFYQLFLPDNKWEMNSDLRGKTVVITGGNAGIGLAIVQSLLKGGAKVIVGCRDTDKARHVLSDAVSAGSDVTICNVDLASFASIRLFANKIIAEQKKIDVLINNAGIFHCPKMKTENGFKMEFGVNYLGHFLLTKLLLPRLKESAPSRVVNMSSILHFWALEQIQLGDVKSDRVYFPGREYSASKLAMVLFTRELGRRLEGTGVTSYAVHPGAIKTTIASNLREESGNLMQAITDGIQNIFFRDVETVQTPLYCALEESLAAESGYYYSGCRRLKSSAFSRNDAAAQMLWKASETFTKDYL